MYNFTDILNKAFNNIKNKYYKGQEWFITEINEKHFQFGSKQSYWFDLYVIEGNYITIYAYKLNTPKEMTGNIGKIISKALEEHKINAIVSAEKVYETTSETKSIKIIFEYLT